MNLAHQLPTQHRLWSCIAMIAVTIISAACANFQDIAPTATPIDKLSLSTPQGVHATDNTWPQEDWWRSFGDPQLNQLIQHALSNSPTLAIAQTRIAHAQAAANVSQSAAGLQMNATADPTYGRLSANYIIPPPPFGPGGQYANLNSLALNFSYDLDLWGKNAALIHAAKAQVKAAEFDRDAARLALTTTIARSYLMLASQYALQDVLQSTQKQRQTIHNLTEQRVANGLDTRIELKQSETSEAALRIDQAQLTTAIDVTRLQLAALCGEMPAAATTITQPNLSSMPLNIPQTIPLNLLSRRPELAAQRARIDAALGEKQAAKAKFYPDINLVGLIGFQSIGLGQLLASGSMMNSIGPAISLPLFDTSRANYAMKSADLDGAITQYNQSVINAAQDVAEQLTRVAALTHEEEATHDALAAAEEAYRLAMLRYRAGLSPYLTVLAAETPLLTQRRATMDLNAKRNDLHIALVRALGGGFQNAIVAINNDAQR